MIKLNNTEFELVNIDMSETIETDRFHSTIVTDVRYPYQKVVGKTTLEVKLTFESYDSNLDWNSLSFTDKYDILRKYLNNIMYNKDK